MPGSTVDWQLISFFFRSFILVSLDNISCSYNSTDLFLFNAFCTSPLSLFFFLLTVWWETAKYRFLGADFHCHGNHNPAHGHYHSHNLFIIWLQLLSKAQGFYCLAVACSHQSLWQRCGWEFWECVHFVSKNCFFQLISAFGCSCYFCITLKGYDWLPAVQVHK